MITRDHVISVLRQYEPELRGAGIGGLYLFGSVANGDVQNTSDVDLFFDLEREDGFTLFSLLALRDRMQGLLGTQVDLMSRSGIHPRRRSRIESTAVRVF
jgi:hypothetical protein